MRDRVKGPMTFKALTHANLADLKFQHQRIYEKKSNWFSKRFLPVLGGSTFLDKITENKIEKYLEVRYQDKGYQGTKAKPATVNREWTGLKHLLTWAWRKIFCNKILLDFCDLIRKTRCGMKCLIRASLGACRCVPRTTCNRLTMWPTSQPCESGRSWD